MATKKTVKKASTKAPAKKAAAKTSVEKEVVAKAEVKITAPTVSAKVQGYFLCCWRGADSASGSLNA